MKKPFAVLLAVLCGSSVSAQETTDYRYDALGRLILSDARIGTTGGRRSNYWLDNAGNRKRVLSHVVTRVGTLPSQQSLLRGQGVRSPNGKNVLYLQQDGNLALFNEHTAGIWWSNTNTSTATSYHLDMQNDGNLVLYNGSQAVWASGTNGNIGAYAEVTDSGKLVVRRSDGVQIWQN